MEQVDKAVKKSHGTSGIFMRSIKPKDTSPTDLNKKKTVRNYSLSLLIYKETE